MTALLLSAFAVAGQNQDALKERKAMDKMSTNELNEKATKAARKASKTYVKEGWKVAPGALPLDKQLDRSYKMQYEIDESGMPKWIMAEAMSVGANYDAAKIQALELAKQNLAGQISTELTALVENTVANSQMDAGLAASVTETVTASKNLISQRIGRVMTVVECYRTNPKTKSQEVRVMIAYNSDMAMSAAQETVKEQLEKKGIELHGQLDKALGL